MRPYTTQVLLVLTCCTMMMFNPARLAGQDGNVWTTLGGAALGAYSGGVFGTLGGVMPCGYALRPAACSRTWAFSGGVIAGIAGARIGYVNRAELGNLAKTAAIGLGAGVALGAAIAPFMKQHYGVMDVLAIGLIGGAVGASPVGAAIGFGTGLVGGTLLWLVVDEATSQDALQTALLGLAVGGISGWAANALQAEVVLPMSVSF